MTTVNPMILDADIRTRLFRGERAATELAAHRPGHRRFVVVAGFKDRPRNDPAWPSMPWYFRLNRYEVKEALMDESPGSESLEDFESTVVDASGLEDAIVEVAGEGATLRPGNVVAAPY
jgi:hypothetical protein